VRRGEKRLRRSARCDADNLNQNAAAKIVGNYALVTRRFLPVVYPILLQIEALDLAAPQTLYATRDPGNTGEGSMKRGNKKILARGAMAGVIALAACVTSTVGKAEERPLFVSTG
jgi:hypothetical protein